MSSDPTLRTTLDRLDTRLFLTIAVFVLALATILGAWGFEHIGGYIPCQLCLRQRIPYYVGTPIAAIALFAALTGRVALSRLALLIVGGIFVWSAYEGGFHAGVEWDWWEGPSSCAGEGGSALNREAGNLLSQLDQGKTIVSCSEASWRFPKAEWGLSFAGWNAVVSLVIAGAALTAAALPQRSSA